MPWTSISPFEAFQNHKLELEYDGQYVEYAEYVKYKTYNKYDEYDEYARYDEFVKYA